jgi:geranylgeranyl pyrophosphate synthase
MVEAVNSDFPDDAGQQTSGNDTGVVSNNARQQASGNDSGVVELQLRDKRAIVNSTLRKLLAQYVGIDNDLQAAIKYTLEAPGKRIRSALVLWCCEVVSPPGRINRDAEVAAAAVEMVHTYSLVHDDLPAMDNDDLRRGQPTCHRAFDEATAILTGDALLTLAFEVLAERISEPAIAVKLIRQLAHDAGPAGMIAGQMADLKAENSTPVPAATKQMQAGTKELIQFIHTNKTAKMFRCAAAMGAICGGANDVQLNALCEYGLKTGLGFQIADDILDASATSEHLGKTVGKDVKAGKVTYLKLLGMEKSRQLEKRLADEAVAALELFGKDAHILRQLAVALLQRTR